MSWFSFLFPWVDEEEGAEGCLKGSNVGVFNVMLFFFFLAGDPALDELWKIVYSHAMK